MASANLASSSEIYTTSQASALSSASISKRPMPFITLPSGVQTMDIIIPALRRVLAMLFAYWIHLPEFILQSFATDTLLG